MRKEYGKKEDDQMYHLYINEKLGSEKIAKIMGIDPRTICRRLKNMGVNLKGHQAKFNENVFDCIDTEEKAYWLGFIYADGWIADVENGAKSNRYNYAFRINLSAKDVDHLYKFNKFMEYRGENTKLYDGKRYDKIYKECKWDISNKHMWNILNNYGCIPNKSMIVKFPDENIFKSKDLIRHFIRGYFDGDGCISYADKNHKYPNISIAGSESFLNTLRSYFGKEYILQKLDCRDHIHVFSCSNRKAFNFINTLYHNSNIYLDRKYDLFLYFSRLYKELYNDNKPISVKGEIPNTEISSETKKSEPSYSVEIETEKSE